MSRPLFFILLAVVVVVAGAVVGAVPVGVSGGTPDDSYTIERYFTEAAGTQNTTSTTYVDVVSCTFTPPATKDYLIIVSALTNNSSTSYATITQVNINGTGYSETYHTPVNASMNWRSFGSQKIITATGGVAQSIIIQYKTEHVDGTAYIQRASIAVIEVAHYYYAEQNAETLETSTTYVDKTTLTFDPPAGDYMLLTTANSRNGVVGKDTFVELNIDGVQDEVIRTGNSPYASWAAASKLTLTAEEHTIKIRYLTEAGGTAYIKCARIIVVKLSDVGAYYYASSPEEIATQSINYVDKVTLNFTPTHRKDYFIITDGLGRQENTGYAFYANLDVNGTSYGEYIFVAPARTVYRAFQMLNHVNLPAASNTIKIQYKTNKASSSTEAFIKHANVAAIEADTAESYADGAHTTVTNTYASSQTAYIWAHGLRASHNNYAVAYYDGTVSGGGDLIHSQDVMATAYGNLSSQYLLSTDPLATNGTWHAVVFDKDYGTPPSTYEAALTNVGYVVEDSFTVGATVISIANTPGSYGFGVVEEGDTPDTGLTWFTVTNNSTVAVNITISGTNMSGGSAWTLADDGTPGANIVAIKVGLEEGSYNVIVRNTGPYNTLVSNLGASATQRWGLQLLAPTSFSDGGQKSGTITLTATEA